MRFLLFYCKAGQVLFLTFSTMFILGLAFWLIKVSRLGRNVAERIRRDRQREIAQSTNPAHLKRQYKRISLFWENTFALALFLLCLWIWRDEGTDRNVAYYLLHHVQNGYTLTLEDVLTLIVMFVFFGLFWLVSIGIGPYVIYNSIYKNMAKRREQSID